MFDAIGEGHRIMHEGVKKEIDLDELERLAKAAEPLPWREDVYMTDHGNSVSAVYNIDGDMIVHTDESRLAEVFNCEYIAAACNAVPELMARVRELERQREFFIEALDKEHLCPRNCWPDGSSADMQNCIEMNAKACWIRAYKHAAKEAGE